MASPQVENGYTRIANELLQAICNKLTDSTWIRMLLWTIRLTYGFNRKEVQSNYGAYATKLNLTKDTVKRSLLELSDRKIIVLAVITKEQFVITINKDYELWKIE
jgi:phage replication O-like protein O